MKRDMSSSKAPRDTSNRQSYLNEWQSDILRNLVDNTRSKIKKDQGTKEPGTNKHNHNK